MQPTLHRGLVAAVYLAALVASTGSGLAQAPVVETVTTTTTTDGVVSEYGPKSVVITASDTSTPARYVFRESTTYVNELGQPVSASVIQAGQPVAIHYVREGDALVAAKVIVRNSPAAVTSVTETTASTAVTGFINSYGPEGLGVRVEATTDPLFYHLARTTTYVDEAGAPVAVETLRSGLPVTVYYTRSPDGMLASKVVVRSAAIVTPAAPAPVIERTTTTTRTQRTSGAD